MHNKSLIVDNQVAIVGGRNIGDEYFERNRDFAFGDLDLMAIGPVVPDVSNAFDLYWNHQLSVPISAINPEGDEASLHKLRAQLLIDAKQQRQSEYRAKVEQSNLLSELRHKNLNFYWGPGRVIYDHPEKLLTDENDSTTHLLPALKSAIREIRSELVIFSPYFVPTESGVEMFEVLEQSGINVIILTNSLAANDVPAVHAGYQRYRVKLLQAGVELYELMPIQNGTGLSGSSGFSGSSRASLHAKSMVIDRKRIFVGSFNLDPRSIHLNTEMGILVESGKLASDLMDWLDTNLAQMSYRLELVEAISTDSDENQADPQIRWIEQRDGQQIIYDSEPEASLWRRLQVLFFSILPIEDQL